MATVLAVGGPKGGVGKTTVALNIATYASRLCNLKTLLVDADPNRSSLDAARAAGDSMPFDVAAGAEDHDKLVQLHGRADYDLIVVDLPGAREAGALQALLAGTAGGSGRRSRRGRPAIDGIILPTRPEIMDIRPFRRSVQNEIIPLDIPYLVVLVRVHRDRVKAGKERREEIRGWGFNVADTMTRLLVVHDDALELMQPLMDLPGGRRSIARAADREYRAMAAEALALVGIDTQPILDTLVDETQNEQKKD
jgi:chromosome partitioning protein